MTDESPDLVDKWVKQYKPSYPIVILKSGKFEDFLGVKFFPTAAVIAPDGKLLYSHTMNKRDPTELDVILDIIKKAAGK